MEARTEYRTSPITFWEVMMLRGTTRQLTNTLDKMSTTLPELSTTITKFKTHLSHQLEPIDTFTASLLL